MKIRVRAFGPARDKLGTKDWLEMDLNEGAAIHDLLKMLEANEDEVMTVLKKGVRCEDDYVICENDELQLIPPIFAG